MELNELSRSRLRSGRLPAAERYRLYAGKGDGSLCACCDRFITSGEIQFEVECCGPRAAWSPLSMQSSCLHAWGSEWDALMPRATECSQQRRSREQR